MGAPLMGNRDGGMGGVFEAQIAEHLHRRGSPSVSGHGPTERRALFVPVLQPVRPPGVLGASAAPESQCVVRDGA